VVSRYDLILCGFSSTIVILVPSSRDSLGPRYLRSSYEPRGGDRRTLGLASAYESRETSFETAWDTSEVHRKPSLCGDTLACELIWAGTFLDYWNEKIPNMRMFSSSCGTRNDFPLKEKVNLKPNLPAKPIKDSTMPLNNPL